MFHRVPRWVKAVILYLIGLGLIGSFILMQRSAVIAHYLEGARRYRTDTGFAFYAIVGLVEYGTLVAGLSVLTSVTIVLLRRRSKGAEWESVS